MFYRSVLIPVLTMVLQASPPPAAAQGRAWPAGAEAAAQLHPSELIQKALPLLKVDRGDEATFWYYAGQLRWRASLKANPDQDPTGEPAAASAFFATVGPTVNGWAFGDIPRLQRTIDAVLAWDNRYPGPALRAAPHAEIRTGLERLRAQIGREADRIRSERAANGLPNR